MRFFGDLLALVKAERRIGIDPDKGAITLARILHPRIQFIAGDLTALDQVSGPIDVLLAIGWVHHVSPEYLKAALAPHLGRIDHIIVDRFIGAESDYHHDFTFLGQPDWHCHPAR